MKSLASAFDHLLDRWVNQSAATAACGSVYCETCYCGSIKGCRECRVCDGVRQCMPGCQC